MSATLGQIVHYALNAADVDDITHQLRAPGMTLGNEHTVGQTVPAVIVRVWAPGQPNESCNLQLFLDGRAQLWATSRYEGEGPGTWTSPPTA